MNASDRRLPLLWQLEISHYSEKVRWALDRKRLPHRRRAVPPGVHIAVALYLTRGTSVTFPILELGDGPTADSTAAIAALERRHPDPPLYPEDPAERRRALALEELFDEELGPAARLLPLHALRGDRRLFGEFAALTVPAPLSRAKPLLAAYASLYTATRFGSADRVAAERAREQILVALDRLERELAGGDGSHLVGERFSVADLTAASMLSLLVLPAGGPMPTELELPPDLAAFRAELRERPGWLWVEETYARYRGAPAAAAAA